jgi:4-hydroxy-tetrahydrodipicolinate synthase
MADWRLKGCIIPVVTPFKPAGEIDEGSLRRIVDYVIEEQGADGIIPCGTTGESPTLSYQEHLRVIEVVLEHTASRVPVIAGTGSNSTAEAIEMTVQAEKLGVDGTLQVGPYYNRPSQEGIYRHFRAVAEATSLPVIIYNIPARTGRSIEPETVVRLSAIDSIVGIKDASGSIQYANALFKGLRDAGSDLYVYSGEDALTFLILCLGGQGCIAAVGHVLGREFASMCRLVEEGSIAEARDLHYRVLPLVDALFCEPNPTGFKQALAWMGQPAGALRLPLVEMSEPGKGILRRAMLELGKAREEDCV